MESKFKTNVKCTACVARITPYLNEAAGADNWAVNLSSPDRTLIVKSSVSETAVKDALKKAGYTAEKIQIPEPD